MAPQPGLEPTVRSECPRLAGVVHDYGPVAIGDVLGRLGGHLRSIAESQAAQAEAEAGKQKGEKPQ